MAHLQQDDGRQTLPAMNTEPISRPSSTSTQNSSLHHSASLPQLPGLSTLASLASRADSPQLRAFNIGSGLGFSTLSPSATSGGGQSNLPPTCQNCTTSTTPLWRRDELGSVLCNACGLFLKLHGRPRPISLKTDVIKSRNRVKNSGSAAGGKKKHIFDSNGLDQRSQAGTPPPGSLGYRRTSQKSQNGHSDGSGSPISRGATPSMYSNHMPQFNGTHSLDDPYSHHSPSLAPMHLRQPSPGRSASPMNGAHGLEVPQTYEQLIAQNSSLKTRVSELEVINELFRGRVGQLEQDEATARRGEQVRLEANQDLQRRLEESQRRESQLKHRCDDLEREVSDLKDGAPRTKKMRVSDMVGDSEASTPQSVT